MIRHPKKMSPELIEEIESRVATQLESQDCWEEGETRTQDQMETVALEDIIALEKDCGGLFEPGILPEFSGSPGWVAEMKARQAASLADMERQRKAWLKLWNEARRELARRSR